MFASSTFQLPSEAFPQLHAGSLEERSPPARLSSVHFSSLSKCAWSLSTRAKKSAYDCPSLVVPVVHAVVDHPACSSMKRAVYFSHSGQGSGEGSAHGSFGPASPSSPRELPGQHIRLLPTRRRGSASRHIAPTFGNSSG